MEDNNIRDGNYDRQDRISSRSDHDLLIRVDTRLNELCKDIKEVAAEVKTINNRCNIQPRQCASEFLTREAFKLQFDALIKSWQEDRRRFRWSLGIIMVVVNILATFLMHLFPVIK